MKSKKLWTGMLILVITFGFLAMGCGEDDKSTPEPENRTWFIEGSHSAGNITLETLDLKEGETEFNRIAKITIKKTTVMEYQILAMFRYSKFMTMEKKKKYEIKFKAWTENADKPIVTRNNYFYSDIKKSTEVNLISPRITIENTEPKEYSYVTFPITSYAKDFDKQLLEFYFGNTEAGTIYIQMISIEETTKATTEFEIKDLISKWTEPASTVKLDYELMNDDIIKVMVSGNKTYDDYPRSWYGQFQIQYFGEIGKNYTFKFNAWTDDPNDYLVGSLQYEYNPETEEVLFLDTSDDINNIEDDGNTTTIYSNRLILKDDPEKEYTFTSTEPLTFAGYCYLTFQSGIQNGTYYVKLISIEEAP